MTDRSTPCSAAVHEPEITVDAEGFRIVCPCGWISAPSQTIGGGPIYCVWGLVTHA